jgi:hypothetical protein
MTSLAHGAVKGCVNFVTSHNMIGYRMFFANKKIVEEEEIVEHKAWFSLLPDNSVGKNAEAPQH